MPWVPASSVLCPPPIQGAWRGGGGFQAGGALVSSLDLYTPTSSVHSGPGRPPGPGLPAGPRPAESPAPRRACTADFLRDSATSTPVLRVPPVSRDSSGTHLRAFCTTRGREWARAQQTAPGHSAEPPSFQTRGPLQHLPGARGWQGPERRGRDSEHELLPCELVTPVAIRVCDAASAKGVSGCGLFQKEAFPLEL